MTWEKEYFKCFKTLTFLLGLGLSFIRPEMEKSMRKNAKYDIKCVSVFPRYRVQVLRVPPEGSGGHVRGSRSRGIQRNVTSHKTFNKATITKKSKCLPCREKHATWFCLFYKHRLKQRRIDWVEFDAALVLKKQVRDIQKAFFA